MAGGRLGFGAYTCDDLSRGIAQISLLEAVAELVPDMLATLRDDVLSVYAEAHAGVEARARDPELFALELRRYILTYGDRLSFHTTTNDLHRWQHVGRAGTNDELGFTWYPDLIPLRTALVAWGDRWHLNREWVYKAALDQLDIWRQHPQFLHPAGHPLHWLALRGAAWMGPGDSPAFAFELPPWDSVWKTRKVYEAAAGEAFALALSAYLDSVEVAVQAVPSFQATADLLSWHKHLAWLVRYQVLRQPWPEIAATADRELANGRRVPVSADFVARRVKELAALIDLPLHPVRKAGRPAGKTNENPTQNRVTGESRRR